MNATGIRYSLIARIDDVIFVKNKYKYGLVKLDVEKCEYFFCSRVSAQGSQIPSHTRPHI